MREGQNRNELSPLQREQERRQIEVSLQRIKKEKEQVTRDQFTASRNSSDQKAGAILGSRVFDRLEQEEENLKRRLERLDKAV